MKKFYFTPVVLLAALFVFTSCGDDPEPSSNSTEEGMDYATLIKGRWYNPAIETSDDLFDEHFSIGYDGNKIAYAYSYYPDNREYDILAEGTYKLSKNQLTATYDDVYVDTPESSNRTYMGFSNKKTRVVKYMIQSCTKDKISLKDDSGKVYNFVKQ